MYHLSPERILVIVKDLVHDGEKHVAECLLLSGEVPRHIDKEINLSVPVRRLIPVEGNPLNLREDRKLATKIAEGQVDTLITKLRDDHHFRRLVREDLLKKLILKEVLSSFKSRNLRKAFTMGISCPEIVMVLFGIHPIRRRRAVFSYKHDNLSELDVLLGDNWDWKDLSGQIVFVTQIVFWLRDNCLHGSVFGGFFPGTVPTENHREVFGRHIRETKLPLPAEEDVEDA